MSIRSIGVENRVLIRDLLIFQLKLLLDGLKDIVVFWMAIGASLLDIVFPGERRGHRFYAVMRSAERFDHWLNLYGAAEHAEENEEGLFGESAAGADTMLGRLEEIVVGRRETGAARS
jgi:hypothetical protein